ncbi:TetR/AcrR family transcriptional regulator [Actinokineospora globicatena]|uniref:Transcriptional regulator n=1 Tax=Actinokineospora globicatena TaxID=103729 RepID=A0A9W6V4P1_9PSEU|nr:TetR/AcrR family transcriptional regulator [Actinokineospora globicatena]MCP2306478.1 transcriptional regulator, TetR family [Actinokineospora globicatena]GLW81907.1 transcriptional regulator [Actinokineospora globicatena]GLW88701.1 transcriptional regulator [Actinokineospora globicatena]GLW89420.1 transcriptional regulator [Actinokineospora globicatena]
MPKVIDHDERRAHIVEVTWGLIMRGGLEAATMREIAEAAGFANGALKRYFPSKDVLVEATFERALAQLDTQVDVSAGQSGLEALRALCDVTMPLDAKRVTAGRVLLAFWEMSLSNKRLHDRYLTHLKAWRGLLATHIRRARAEGDIRTSIPDAQLVDELVLLHAGANVMSLVGARYSTRKLQKAHLDTFFERITTA